MQRPPSAVGNWKSPSADGWGCPYFGRGVSKAVATVDATAIMRKIHQKKTTAPPSRFSRASCQSPLEWIPSRNHVEAEKLLDVRERRAVSVSLRASRRAFDSVPDLEVRDRGHKR